MRRETLEQAIKKLGKITPEERAEVVRQLTGQFPGTAYDKINDAVKKAQGWK